MSNFKIINTHNTISYTKFGYKENIPDLRKKNKHDQEDLINTLIAHVWKEWVITIDGREKNIEAYRSKGDYIATAPIITIYDEAGVNIVKQTKVVTAQEWKEKYYPIILNIFKFGIVVNGQNLVPKGYRPEFIEAIDGGLGWIKAIYSDSYNKVKKEANAVIKDREYITADGLDPDKEKSKKIKTASGEVKEINKVFVENSNNKNSSVDINVKSGNADYKERGYINEKQHQMRLKAESDKGGAISE